MGFLEKKYGISGIEVFKSLKTDFLFKITHLSKDEKDAMTISGVIHFLLFILILVAPYMTDMNKLKSPKKDTVVIFDLENLQLSEKDNLPSAEIEKKAPEKKIVKKKIEKKEIVKKAVKKVEPVKKEAPKVEQKVSDVAKGGSLQLEKNKSKNLTGEKKLNEKSKKVVKKAEAPKSGSMEDLFKSIDEIKTSVAERPKVEKSKSKAQESDIAKETPKASSINSNNKSVADKDVSVSFINAIKYKIKGCWNIDPGAKGIQDIVIAIDSTLTPDGSIDSIRLIDMKSYNSNPHFKAAADSAKRALIDCSPYNLPMDKYSVWKDIRFNFSPSRGAID